ncbi:MAG: prsA1 [Phycisphaerales bacterium]|nr:prsA1 [Phycisphaerales bacterium]
MAILINGQRIDDAILQSEFSEIKAHFERLGNISCCERDPEFRGYARQNVIARVLLAQEARRAVPASPEAEVDAAVAKLVEQFGGEARFYASTGASPEQMHLVRHDVETDLRVRKMVEALCDDVRPSEEVLCQFYEKNIQSFMTAEEVRASHILKAPKRGEEREGAYAALREARKQLQAGGDFDALARQLSDKADDHIDLNFFKRGELAEEFELVAFSMEVGEISPVFASPFGFHLIKVTDRKPATPKPFDTVQDEVRQRYLDEERQDRTRKLVEKLQSNAAVEDVEEPSEFAAT